MTTANVKLYQIRTILQFQHNFEIIGVSKTWLNSTVTDADIALENSTVTDEDITLENSTVP
jgi:hypothetical protein